jgi:hypothetical protein
MDMMRKNTHHIHFSGILPTAFVPPQRQGDLLCKACETAECEQLQLFAPSIKKDADRYKLQSNFRWDL